MIPIRVTEYCCEGEPGCCVRSTGYRVMGAEQGRGCYSAGGAAECTRLLSFAKPANIFL